MKYAIPQSKDTTRASGTFSISDLNAVKVCKSINRKKFDVAKKSLEDLISEKTSLRGKHYTKTAQEILKLLDQVEKNAKNKNLDANALFLFVSAHKGPTMHRARRRWRKFGSKMKVCHVQAVLSSKDNFVKVKELKEPAKVEEKK